MHDKIKATFLDGVKPVPPGQRPTAIMMMGGPASGKSHATQGVPMDQFVRVDPDMIKEKLPEYGQAIDAGARDAAKMVREESSYVAKEIRDEAIQSRKNLLIDGTGKNKEAFLATIQRLRLKGYRVDVRMTDASVE